jgi:two-component system LytT family response regulator
MRDIRIVTADDDAGMRLVMKKIVERAEGFELVGEAGDGSALLKLYEEKRPDVMLMDVEMPSMSGIECARAIQDRDPRAIMVFVTAHEEYMKSAFEVYAFDYLVKPFKAERALQTLSRIRDRLSGQLEEKKVNVASKVATTRLMLKHRDGVSFLDLKSIMLIQREERATVVYTDDGQKFVTGDTLSEFEERLPADQFLRTHKSYIVSLAHVESVSPYGRWTYIIKLRGTRLDALITHERYEIMQKMFI